MDIGDHVRLAVSLAEDGEHEAALLHALQAIDGTGKKLRPGPDTRDRIVGTIDDYLWVIEPMTGMGANLETSIFPFVELRNRPSRFAEILYEVFRTRLAHGDPFPEGTGIDVSIDPLRRSWRAGPGNNITLPDTVIWALVAAAVFARVNAGQRVGTGGWFDYHTLDGSNDMKFPIDEWWGREDEVHGFFDSVLARSVRVTMLDSEPEATEQTEPGNTPNP
jgi:hypothetical protein